MTLEKIIRIIGKNWKGLVLAGLFLSAVSFLTLVTTEKSYKSSTDFLVIQNQNGFSDYYALSKSADFLSGVLMESVYSERFLEEMENSGLPISSFLPQNSLEKLKAWKKMVRVSKNSSLGIASVEILSDNQAQLKQISDSVDMVLTTKNFLFLGKGQDLDVRIMNGPIIEKNPSLTQIWVTIFGGFLVGLVLYLAFLILRASLDSGKTTVFFGEGNSGVISESDLKSRESLDYWSERM